MGAEGEAGSQARQLGELPWALASPDGASSLLGAWQVRVVISLHLSQSPLAEWGSSSGGK